MDHNQLDAVGRHVERIWREVLDVPAGQEGASFFQLQGQSISAVRIVAQIEDDLGIVVDIGELFEDPDLETFVRNVVAKAAGATPKAA
jgi:acyl carrier protein